MGIADMSGCLEVTSGYGNYLRFDSGKFGIFFDGTGDAVERIWGKDPTADVTGAVCLLHKVHLSCATSASIGLFDGSGGGGIVRLRSSELTATAGATEMWDFEDDPIVCLTAENTQSLSVCAGDGLVSGFLKVSWGTRPR